MPVILWPVMTSARLRPEAITKATLKQYRYSPAATELVEFADRGHSLTIDAGWGDVAKACLSWLGDKGL